MTLVVRGELLEADVGGPTGAAAAGLAGPPEVPPTCVVSVERLRWVRERRGWGGAGTSGQD